MDSTTATLAGVFIGSCFSVFSSFLSGWFLHTTTRKEKRRDHLREDMLVKRQKIETLALEEEHLNRAVLDLEFDVLHKAAMTLETRIKELTGEAYKVYAVIPLYFLDLAPLVSAYNETLVYQLNAFGRGTPFNEPVAYREISERRKKAYSVLRGQFRREMETIEKTLRV